VALMPVECELEHLCAVAGRLMAVVQPGTVVTLVACLLLHSVAAAEADASSLLAYMTGMLVQSMAIELLCLAAVGCGGRWCTWPLETRA
jgi:hypothetical protein